MPQSRRGPDERPAGSPPFRSVGPALERNHVAQLCHSPATTNGRRLAGDSVGLFAASGSGIVWYRPGRRRTAARRQDRCSEIRHRELGARRHPA